MEVIEYLPRFYVFNKVFEESEKFQQFLYYLDENYEAWQQKSFQEYWHLNGDNIVLDEYQQKVETETIKCDNKEERRDLCEGVTQFWQQYYENVYAKQYEVYATIFYEYYQHLHQSFKDNVIRKNVEVNNIRIDEIFLDDLEQLQLLGLPTAFGKEQKVPKTYTSSNISSDDTHDGQNDNHKCIEMNTDNQITLSKKTSPDKLKFEKKKNRKLRNVPHFLLEKKGMLKYWRRRFSLFSRYDEGIRLDLESWFSVTPEKIAIHLANRLQCDLIIDAFSGCGGNAIQFARTCKRVVAIDIDHAKLNMAKHNASLYGVGDKIEFINGDFLQICRSGRFRGDVVFLSPPWGGPKYKQSIKYDIENCLQPSGACELMKIAKSMSENVVFYLPRNSSVEQVIKLAGKGKQCEIEHNYLDSRLVAITAIYGKNIIK